MLHSPSPLFAGIDFGTTNSTLGLCAAGATPVLLPLEGEHRTLPSALFFSLEDHSTYFGRAAVHEYVDGAQGRFMRALKSVLGTSLMRERTLVGLERLSFVDLIGRFLGHLKARLEAQTGGEVDRAVFGRPVRFVDESDEADREAEAQLADAARAQGFRHVEFQFEPVAAALFHETKMTQESLALVVDIGGGTSDFSLLRLGPDRAGKPDRRADILASTGVHVGGTDFDKLLNLASMQPLLGLGSETRDGKRRMPVWLFNDLATWHRVNLLYNAKVLRDVNGLRREAAEPEKLEKLHHVIENRSGHRIAGAVEAAKIKLSDESETLIRMQEPGLLLERAVRRDEFETAVSELVSRIDGAVQAALDQAGVAADRVETVILTGGGAQVPAVFEAATKRFRTAEIVRSDAFGSVGLGLGVDAARRFG